MINTGRGHTTGTARLLERRDELQWLAGAIESAAGSKDRLAVVRGQAGIGKSCLLAAASDQARAAGMTCSPPARGLSNATSPSAWLLALFEPLVGAGRPA